VAVRRYLRELRTTYVCLAVVMVACTTMRSLTVRGEAFTVAWQGTALVCLPIAAYLVYTNILLAGWWLARTTWGVRAHPRHLLLTAGGTLALVALLVWIAPRVSPTNGRLDVLLLTLVGIEVAYLLHKRTFLDRRRTHLPEGPESTTDAERYTSRV
jgi:hypothetical protein